MTFDDAAASVRACGGTDGGRSGLPDGLGDGKPGSPGGNRPGDGRGGAGGTIPDQPAQPCRHESTHVEDGKFSETIDVCDACGVMQMRGLYEQRDGKMQRVPRLGKAWPPKP